MNCEVIPDKSTTERYIDCEDLSKKDAIHVLDVIQESLACANEKNFRQLIRSVKQLVPFDAAACVSGRKRTKKAIIRYELVNVSNPDAWLCRCARKKYEFVDPIARVDYAADPRTNANDGEAYSGGTGFVVDHGNYLSSRGFILSLAGKGLSPTPRTHFIIKRIAPHLHRAFDRTIFSDTKRGQYEFPSLRQRQILQWAKEGKSTWDISSILGISGNTVRYHMKIIFRELKAHNRSQAILSAINRGLLHL